MRSKARWKYEEKALHRGREDYGSCTARGEHTAILIDDLSLNPPENPAGGVAARSLSLPRSLAPSTREPLLLAVEALPRKTKKIGGPRPRSVGGTGETPRGTRNPTLQRVRSGQPVGTREKMDLRVGGCRIIINWPLSRVQDLGAIRLCLFLFAHTLRGLRPRRSASSRFALIRGVPSSRYSIDLRREI